MKLYAARFSAVLGVVSVGLLLANAVDILSRFRSTKFTIGLFLNLVSFKVPYLIVEILPIISFITTIIFFEYLVRSNQLVSIFNTGSSIWNIISPVLICLIFIGTLTTTIIQPFSSMLLSSYDKLESRILKKKADSIIISESGVMMAEDYNDEKRFIITKEIDVSKSKLSNITILFTDHENRFIKRIDAEYGFIMHSEFILHNVKIFDNIAPVLSSNLTLPTNLKITLFIENLTPPEDISFWEFYGKLKRLKDSGAPFVKYEIYYYKTLFKSITMISFMLLASCFVNKTYERVSGIKKPFIAVILGFATYLCNEICVSIFIHNGINPMLSILCPLCLIIFFSIFSILHLHEGR